MKSNSALISEWISKQLELGRTDEDLHNKAFYDGSDIYIIKKSDMKGVFNLKCTFGGAVSLNELRTTL
ncbi:UNVERIFIED_CONTAM: hypothetical protein ABIC26_002623 [Paenibacillus sp. PvR008]